GRGQGMLRGHGGVGLVALAGAALPVVPLARGQADPHQEREHGDAGLAGPAVDEVHDLVPRVVGHPDSLQGSPSSFFNCTYSCINSASTSFFCCNFPSRTASLWSLASSPPLPASANAAAPYSKNSFGQR